MNPLTSKDHDCLCNMCQVEISHCDLFWKPEFEVSNRWWPGTRSAMRIHNQTLKKRINTDTWSGLGSF
jgi:hypothetical protein